MGLDIILTVIALSALLAVITTFPKLWCCFRKPFTWGTSVDHIGERYYFYGINIPSGWHFLHVYRKPREIRINKMRSRR